MTEEQIKKDNRRDKARIALVAMTDFFEDIKADLEDRDFWTFIEVRNTVELLKDEAI